MLYMVECRFTDPSREQSWNDWYGGQRLGELLGVPGFRGSQRFRALDEQPIRYLAVHWVDGLEVFRSPAYAAIGGGGFLGYQDCITDWIRRFFAGWDRDMAVAQDERLVVADRGRESVAASGVEFEWLAEAGSGRPRERGIARMPAAKLETLRGASMRDALAIYAPLGAWRPGRQATS